MKTNFSILSTWGRKLQWTSLAALLSGGFGYVSQAVVAPSQPSPAGIWDFVITGPRQQGLAYLTFSSNFTFTGFSLESIPVSNPNAQTTIDPNSRNDGSDTGRGSVTTVTSANPNGTTNVFGFGPEFGPWTYDDHGRIIGFFSQVLDATTLTWPCVNNLLVTTNINGTDYATNLSFCFTSSTFTTNVVFDVNGTNTSVLFTFTTNAIPGAGAITNGISFVGTLVPNKRLTMICSTSLGRIVFTGVPAKTNLTSMSGSWFGYKTEYHMPALQLLGFYSFAGGNPFLSWGIPDSVTNYPNIYYTTNGQGPSSSFSGFAMLSQRKKVGFAFETIQSGNTNGLRSASYGTLQVSRRSTNVVTRGLEEPRTPMQFKATWQSP